MNRNERTVSYRLLKRGEIGDDSVKRKFTESLLQCREISLLIRAARPVSTDQVAHQLQTSVVSLLNKIDGFRDVLCAKCAPTGQLRVGSPQS